MDIESFKRAYTESRNGANCFYRHPFNKIFHYSDGVRECAEAGTYWLLDIAATELPTALREYGEYTPALLVLGATGNKASLELSVDDESPPIWSRSIDYTDMPDGVWKFFVVDEGERIAMILESEY